jgi:RNA polymerase sigma-70 factor (ECF subfamily)
MNVDVVETMPPDAAQLVGKYQRGEGDAGDRLAVYVLSLLKRRLRRLSATEAEVEEVAQECMLSIFQRLDEYDGALGSFEGWVGGFAQNCWRSYVRATTRARKNHVSIDDVSETPYEIGGSVDQRDHLMTAMESLEIIDRELLHMRYSLGMSSEEIAVSSNMNPPQVRKRISRAVERLRRHPATQELLAVPV